MAPSSTDVDGMAQGRQSGERDPDAYAEGAEFGPYGRPHRLPATGAVNVDRLETVHARGLHATAYDLSAWYGSDMNRIQLQAEGEVDAGRVQDSRTELLWQRPLAAFWDGLLGVRQDAGVAPDRTWLVVGISGLAPYWVNAHASFYLGEAGRTALRVGADSEIALTRNWVLQPRVEANLYGRSDPRAGRGAGLSDLVAGLRLHYAITPQLSPYLGVEWSGAFGGSASAIRDEGGRPKQTTFVAGLSFWF